MNAIRPFIAIHLSDIEPDEKSRHQFKCAVDGILPVGEITHQMFREAVSSKYNQDDRWAFFDQPSRKYHADSKDLL
jgi:hypothetical protein